MIVMVVVINLGPFILAVPPMVFLPVVSECPLRFVFVSVGTFRCTFYQLTEAIPTLKTGGTLIKPIITERILRGLEQAKPDFPSLNPPDPLTERETEVLRLMVTGYSNREIADAMGVSEGTVKNHVSSILSKLGVRDRTRAVLKALELGFI